MAKPARSDSSDHLPITAYLYWLTGGDGEGSKVIRYTGAEPRVHTKRVKTQNDGKAVTASNNSR